MYLIYSESEIAQSCPTLCDPMDRNLPGSAVHGIYQARILEWAAISFSRGSSQPRDRNRVSCTADRCFTVWATREALIPPLIQPFNESGLQCKIPEILLPFTILILWPAHRCFLVGLVINVEFEQWSKKSGDNFLTEKTSVDHVPWSQTCGPWTQKFGNYFSFSKRNIQHI